MESKKHPQHQLERKRPLFFVIGLIVALICAISAFEWKSEYHQIEITPKDVPEEVLFNTPITIQQSPPPPKSIKMEKQIKVIALEVIEISNDDIPESFKEEIELPEIDLDQIEVTMPIEQVELYNGQVESPATYPGGWENFYQYVSRSIRFPRKAINIGIDGKVYIQFTINPDGTISNVEIYKGIGLGCDDEAIRVIQNVPEKFQPARNRGVNVPVKMILPIHFQMQ